MIFVAREMCNLFARCNYF